MRTALPLAVSLLLVAGCATTGTYVAPDARPDPTPALPSSDVAYQVFLTGNTADLRTDAVLRALAADARRAGENSAVVFLGDQTASGVPDSASAERAEALRPLQALVDAVEGYEGRVIVLPGDRDWRRGADGLKAQEAFLDAALRDSSALVPGDQGGGPREIELTETFRILALDTAWWLLDPEDRPEGESDGETVRHPSDVATLLERLILDRDDSRLLVIGHHPLRSNGEHGGQRTVGEGVVTLGAGPLVAQAAGLSAQDLAAPGYRRLRQTLHGLFRVSDGLVYAAAHDHSLQAFTETDLGLRTTRTYLVSGTGGGTVRAASGGRGADLVAPTPGYWRLTYFADGSLWGEAVAVDPATGATDVLYRAELAGPNADLVRDRLPDEVPPDSLPDLIGQTVTQAADATFTTGPFRNDAFTRAIWGEGYRDVWKTPVEFEVLDLGTEAGGLTPLKRGGGNQTVSLRLQSAAGHEYNLRLLEKEGTSGLPADLQDGLVADVVLDLRSAALPYGALVAAELADAVDIYTPHPKLVYVPDDPRLGRYREQFGGRLALLEVRPDEDLSALPGFEGVVDAVSSQKLHEEMTEDQDHRVDQRTFLRARLLDLLIADWDRHADQWRWAAFEPGELDPTLTGDEATRGKVYVPIARDRDFAFYAVGGLLQPLLQAGDPRLQPFGEDFGSLRGLTLNGRFQDRRFLNRLTAEDVRAITDDVQARLTDAAIDRAVAELPDPIEAQLGERWRTALRTRRDKLDRVAGQLYEMYSEIVDVVGSDEREVFSVERQPGGALAVTVRSYKKEERGAVLYARTFDPSETDEVRLYGLGGRDRFETTGTGPATIRVRIIGGAGADEVDASGGYVVVYDTPDGVEVDGDADPRLSYAPDVNRYDPTEPFLSNYSFAPVVGYRSTDGVLLGASVTAQIPGFRLRPYAATHTLSVDVATATWGLRARYDGRMRQALGPLDLDVDAVASTPRYVRNFYGLGNGTPAFAPELARVDLGRVEATARLGGEIGAGLRLSAGPTVRYANPGADTIAVGSPLAALPASALKAQTHAGGLARLTLSTADREVNPRQGVRLDAYGAVRAAVSGRAGTYGSVGGEAVAYVPLRFAPQLTLALRAGADHRVGDFPFYDAAVLGQETSLRGYRRERFAGRTAAFGNAEVRAKLLDVSTYALPFTIGLHGFADAGRVWAERDAECDVLYGPLPPGTPAPTLSCPVPSDEIHLGYGGGLWISALDRAVLNVTLHASDEATLFSFGLGFQY